MSLNLKVMLVRDNAIMPTSAKPGDAGLDLTVSTIEYINDGEHVKYHFGIAVEIPEGHVGLLFPRSSIFKHRQLLSNSVGVIDSGYRGEISAVMLGTSHYNYKVGDRAAQLIVMPYPAITIEEVTELSQTERGTGGYGHTGN